MARYCVHLKGNVEDSSGLLGLKSVDLWVPEQLTDFVGAENVMEEPLKFVVLRASTRKFLAKITVSIMFDGKITVWKKGM
jgi:hypothetical protein